MQTNTVKKGEQVESDRFKVQMQHFSDWKARLTSVIKEYKDWLYRYELLTPETELRIYEALKALSGDELRIACVAEFSRGKTELLNAIFFADYGCRLLPSSAGRTTMCPTELFFDRTSETSYIKLLPIETRLSDLTLGQLKNEESYWTTLPLDVDNPAAMAETLAEVIKTKRVSQTEAEGLGLHDDPTLTHKSASGGDEHEVEVPVWRHALVSFPHPLLKQGLVLLDTPGLNALGTEPELTINMLPSAQAVLFVLSADTGVTRSDLEMWTNHIMPFRQHQQKGLIAILNKIDTLWDEMKKPAEVHASITAQCRESARSLGIDPNAVLPISAQKGLLAKAKGDKDLLQKSNLTTLEAMLANEILPAKQDVIWQSVIAGLTQTIEEVRQPLASQLDDIKTQFIEVSNLRNQKEDVVEQLLEKANDRKAAYYESVRRFQLHRRKLAVHAKATLSALDVNALDLAIKKTREEMSGSWTTGGMKQGMSSFFDGLRDAMQIFSRQADETHQMVLSIYRKFHEDYDLKATPPAPFPYKKYIEGLDQLYLSEEAFRNSPVTTMTEQSFVVKKFFISLVSHARAMICEVNKEADLWLREMVNPLVRQIQEKRNRIEQHMRTMSKIRESRQQLELQVRRLEAQTKVLEEKLASLDRLKGALGECVPADLEAAPSQEKLA
ncbi:MAG: hypothetical protein GC138_03175 [Gammaproteobacteria bacterium]|nr:hypothetical protein [Gammaproteobacteria bacterium]